MTDILSASGKLAVGIKAYALIGAFVPEKRRLSTSRTLLKLWSHFPFLNWDWLFSLGNSQICCPIFIVVPSASTVNVVDHGERYVVSGSCRQAYAFP
jgi:hypothetical protein